MRGSLFPGEVLTQDAGSVPVLVVEALYIRREYNLLPLLGLTQA